MGVWTTTPRTWVAGEVPTATHFNENLRDFGRAFADAWTAYTPTLTASTTSPTNWTQTGYYMQAGKLVICRFLLTAGGSMTAGSGTYRVALPVNASTTLGEAPGPNSTMCVDSSASLRFTPSIVIPNTAYLEFRYQATWPTGSATAVTNSAPWTWAASDTIAGALIYEAA